MKPGMCPDFPVMVNDWLSSTAVTLMTVAEEGAYWRLLCHAWNDPGCLLPDDDASLAALSRLGDAWNQGSGAKIRRCFTTDPERPGFIYNVRQRATRIEQQRRIERANTKCAIMRDAKERKRGQSLQEPLEAPLKASLQEPLQALSSPLSPLPSPLTLPSFKDVGQNELIPSAPGGAPASVSDEQWLEGLKADPAYSGIDIGHEHAKLVRWCKENRKQPTRRRFINWLNRADKPLSVPKSQKPSATESF
jgi:uncharacterized protein YdaU (DUF1376 family)